MTPRVCSFESRRASEMESLIRRHGGEPTVAPSMQEVPLQDNDEAIAFGRKLFDGGIDVIVFLTGVGADALFQLLESRYGWTEIHAAMERCTIVVRGPKPTAVLRGKNVRIDLKAPEPNTWREVVTVLQDADLLNGRRIAIQEYGLPSTELYAALQSHGATVSPVPIYAWSLPDDIGPLQNAVQTTIAGGFDVLMFTSAQQVAHVLQVAEQMNARDNWLAAAGRCVVASIGPTTTEALQAVGLQAGVEASPSKMGQFVAQTMAFVGSA